MSPLIGLQIVILEGAVLSLLVGGSTLERNAWCGGVLHKPHSSIQSFQAEVSTQLLWLSNETEAETHAYPSKAPRLLVNAVESLALTLVAT
jgi:hypothetical protein